MEFGLTTICGLAAQPGSSISTLIKATKMRLIGRQVCCTNVDLWSTSSGRVDGRTFKRITEQAYRQMNRAISVSKR